VALRRAVEGQKREQSLWERERERERGKGLATVDVRDETACLLIELNEAYS